MSSGSKNDPWLSEGWPANELTFAEFFPKPPEDLPPVAPPPPPIDAFKDSKLFSGGLADAGKQPPLNTEYYFDSFKVLNCDDFANICLIFIIISGYS
jgi:hypothetical protein